MSDQHDNDDDAADEIEEGLEEAPTPGGISEEVAERAEEIGELPPDDD